jgi:hypothetical protein
LSLSNAAQYPEVAALFAPASEPEGVVRTPTEIIFGTPKFRCEPVPPAPPVLEERDREVSAESKARDLLDQMGLGRDFSAGDVVGIANLIAENAKVARLEAIVAAQEALIEEMERQARYTAAEVPKLVGQPATTLQAIAGFKGKRLHIDAARYALVQAKEGHPHE